MLIKIHVPCFFTLVSLLLFCFLVSPCQWEIYSPQLLRSFGWWSCIHLCGLLRISFTFSMLKKIFLFEECETCSKMNWPPPKCTWVFVGVFNSPSCRLRHTMHCAAPNYPRQVWTLNLLLLKAFRGQTKCSSHVEQWSLSQNKLHFCVFRKGSPLLVHINCWKLLKRGRLT